MKLPHGFRMTAKAERERLMEFKNSDPAFKDIDLLKLDPVSRRTIVALIEKNGEERIRESGGLAFRTCRDEFNRRIEVPEGDSGAWLRGQPYQGFRGKFASLKHVNGKPFLASVAESRKRVVYDL